jgi:hypothetical protein
MRWVASVVVGLLLFLAPADAFAQRMMQGDPVAISDSLVARYDVRLNLTVEQASGVHEILTSQGTKGQELLAAARGQGREAMREMRPKMDQLQAETSEQIEALLTEDQIPEYREIQAEIQEQRQARMRQRQPGG